MTRLDTLQRWKKYIIAGGTVFDKFKNINNHVLNKAKEHRLVTKRNLREWALQRALNFKSADFKFSAYVSWVKKFKKAPLCIGR